MNIVFLSFRIAGLDGVSLEAVHWKEILERMGHKVTFLAGELDRSGVLLPELHFKWPYVYQIHERVVYGDEKYEDVERGIFTLAGKIEGKLREVLRHNGKVDLLIVANIFSLPMHFPLTVALSRIVGEYSIPTIARHHDFWWERQKYLESSLFKFFENWFPPKLPTVKHTVINSIAKAELKKRYGLDADIISDTFDFASNKAVADSYSKHFRPDFEIGAEDKVFLQPTRIVPRKRIELSIEFIKALNDPNAVLVISQREGDEQPGYEKKLKKLAQETGIRCKFIGDRVNSQRKIISGKRIYTLWDCYVNADFVTYPTEVEGFGNQFVETMYFKKPIILTPYPVYKSDIAPLGFETIELNGANFGKAVAKVNSLIADGQEYDRLVEKNFKIGEKHFSYDSTREKIKKILQTLPSV